MSVDHYSHSAVRGFCSELKMSDGVFSGACQRSNWAFLIASRNLSTQKIYKFCRHHCNVTDLLGRTGEYTHFQIFLFYPSTASRTRQTTRSAEQLVSIHIKLYKIYISVYLNTLFFLVYISILFLLFLNFAFCQLLIYLFYIKYCVGY